MGKRRFKKFYHNHKLISSMGRLVSFRGQELQLTSRQVKLFWSKVDTGRVTDCWEWMGCYNDAGYGSHTISINKARVEVSAHRFAYLLIAGELGEYTGAPDDILICHKCDNPACCNPSHLFAGTNKDNMADKKNKGRCNTPRGEDRYNAKLTETDVLEIRRIHNGTNIASLAKQFGIGTRTLRDIVNRRGWTHI